MFKKQVFSGLNHSRQAFFLVLDHANSSEIKRPNLAGELSVFPRETGLGDLLQILQPRLRERFRLGLRILFHDLFVHPLGFRWLL